jgi:hypothetical protein
MPLAKMRSIGAVCGFWPTAVFSSVRLRPDQNSRSKSSLLPRTFFRPKSLPKMTVQLTSEVMARPAITTCTTRLACRMRAVIDKSWFIGGQ